MRLFGLALVVLGGLLAAGRRVAGKILPVPPPDPGNLAPVTPIKTVDIDVEGYAPAPETGLPWEARDAAQPWIGEFRAAESRYGLPHGLLSRVAFQESRYRADARSPAGALGMMQFMPATAQEWGVDPLDPGSAIEGAGRYLQWLHGQLGSWAEALAAYNWGIGNVQRKGIGAAPLETRNYVREISSDVGLG